MKEILLPEIWEYIDKHTDKRSVMGTISKFWNLGSPEYVAVENVYMETFEGHGHDTRDSGERYFRHVLGVVSILLYLFDKKLVKKDINLLLAAFLHDLPEDKPADWPFVKIKLNYGPDVKSYVYAVTKPPYGDKFGERGSVKHAKATIKRIKKGGHNAIILKLCDRLHNMLTLWGTLEKRVNKIKETLVYYIPLAVKVGILVDELVLAVALQMHQNKTVGPDINENDISEVCHR